MVHRQFVRTCLLRTFADGMQLTLGTGGAEAPAGRGSAMFLLVHCKRVTKGVLLSSPKISIVGPNIGCKEANLETRNDDFN